MDQIEIGNVKKENPDDETIEYEEYYIEEIVETEEAPEYVEEEYIIESEEIDESIESTVQYQCDKCFKLFDKHYNLEQHMQHHTDAEFLVSTRDELLVEDEYETIAEGGDDDTLVQEENVANVYEEEEISYEEIEYNGELIFKIN